VTLCKRRRLRTDEVIHEGHNFAAARNVRFWHKADIPVALRNAAFGGKADITATERNFNLRLAQKLRQLGDIRRNPPRLVAREQRRIMSVSTAGP
jgi:hypothetical protein